MRKGEGGIRKVDWKGIGHSVKIEHSEISDKSNAMPYALCIPWIVTSSHRTETRSQQPETNN